MIARVRNQQQHPRLSAEERGRHKGARGREMPACGRQVVSADQFRHDGECNLPLPECRGRDRTSPKYLKSQGPEVHTVPPQLLSMLRLKTVKEDMRRAAAVELHDPVACSVSVQCLPKPFNAPHWIWEGTTKVVMCGSQQPGVAVATAKERGVALATDEMRGYPDKNATGTHLASPRCPFSDR
ncbi:Nephrin [Dissostichus eleginoides]|uniref:Nephrin n=1 Tax=Dissostichus eleginoides TaxID=100907 RepID=A0AAD9CKF0_DISEL|nr:Nephrin [Dissostichus eleginoides]